MKPMITQPLIFEPIFMERVWGGRRLESLYGKRLPSAALIGESWEFVDRPEAQSVVHEGPLRGTTLHELWCKYREEIFGKVPDFSRFPILAKLLDAQENLSLQVHPPREIAKKLGVTPKIKTSSNYQATQIGIKVSDSDLKKRIKTRHRKSFYNRILRKKTRKIK